jgi:hypothetical protein
MDIQQQIIGDSEKVIPEFIIKPINDKIIKEAESLAGIMKRDDRSIAEQEITSKIETINKKIIDCEKTVSKLITLFNLRNMSHTQEFVFFNPDPEGFLNELDKEEKYQKIANIVKYIMDSNALFPIIKGSESTPFFNPPKDVLTYKEQQNSFEYWQIFAYIVRQFDSSMINLNIFTNPNDLIKYGTNPYENEIAKNAQIPAQQPYIIVLPPQLGAPSLPQQPIQPLQPFQSFQSFQPPPISSIPPIPSLPTFMGGSRSTIRGGIDDRYYNVKTVNKPILPQSMTSTTTSQTQENKDKYIPKNEDYKKIMMRIGYSSGGNLYTHVNKDIKSFIKKNYDETQYFNSNANKKKYGNKLAATIYGIDILEERNPEKMSNTSANLYRFDIIKNSAGTAIDLDLKMEKMRVPRNILDPLYISNPINKKKYISYSNLLKLFNNETPEEQQFIYTNIYNNVFISKYKNALEVIANYKTIYDLSTPSVALVSDLDKMDINEIKQVALNFSIDASVKPKILQYKVPTKPLTDIVRGGIGDLELYQAIFTIANASTLHYFQKPTKSVEDQLKELKKDKVDVFIRLQEIVEHHPELMMQELIKLLLRKYDLLFVNNLQDLVKEKDNRTFKLIRDRVYTVMIGYYSINKRILQTHLRQIQSAFQPNRVAANIVDRPPSLSEMLDSLPSAKRDEIRRKERELMEKYPANTPERREIISQLRNTVEKTYRQYITNINKNKNINVSASANTNINKQINKNKEKEFNKKLSSIFDN